MGSFGWRGTPRGGGGISDRGDSPSSEVVEAVDCATLAAVVVVRVVVVVLLPPNGQGRLLVRGRKGGLAAPCSLVVLVEEAMILDGSPWTGCVTMGTGGGTGRGRGVGMSTGDWGLMGAESVPGSVSKPSPWSSSSSAPCLGSSRPEELRRSLLSIRSFPPVPSNAVLRNDPFLFLMLRCCTAIAMEPPVGRGLEGGSLTGELGDSDF